MDRPESYPGELEESEDNLALVSGGISVQPPCGDPPPDIQELSPGDSTPCWEYKWSGPVVYVCVIEMDTISKSKDGMAKLKKADGGDCEVKEVQHG